MAHAMSIAKVSPLAGKPAPASMLVNVPRLVTAYYAEHPDPSVAAERVAFGTSGHRGSAFERTFNEAHILAITQAICSYRQAHRIDGPLFMGMDTHALSEPAFASALEVLAANGVEVMIDRDRGYTPTPVISHAILRYNRGRTSGLADGIVVTPSHNPPEDGGFKYNPPTGGPADTEVTGWIEQTRERAPRRRACAPSAACPTSARAARRPRISTTTSRRMSTTSRASIDMEAIRSAGVRIGVDPLGGAGVHYWEPIIARYGIAVTVVNDAVDPTFRFMTVDWDGKIRTDCSSPYAMAPLVAMRDRFDVAFANDADHDRHGIVTPTAGLMNPNHYLAVAISYLFTHRPEWSTEAAVGKTVVSSGIIDRVTTGIGTPPARSPGRVQVVRGRPAARLARLRRRGKRRGVVPAHRRHDVDHRQGRHRPRPARGGDHGHAWRRSWRALRRAHPRARRAGVRADRCARDAGAETAPPAALPDQVDAKELAGDAIRAILTTAPGNGASIGGLKVITDNGWFAVRPSGTEEVYKLYAESFRDRPHLERIQAEAQALVTRLFAPDCSR